MAIFARVKGDIYTGEMEPGDVLQIFIKGNLDLAFRLTVGDGGDLKVYFAPGFATLEGAKPGNMGGNLEAPVKEAAPVIVGGPPGHHITKCRACGTVVGQCRCPGPKQIIWVERCESCKVEPADEVGLPHWGRELAQIEKLTDCSLPPVLRGHLERSPELRREVFEWLETVRNNAVTFGGLGGRDA